MLYKTIFICVWYMPICSTKWYKSIKYKPLWKIGADHFPVSRLFFQPKYFPCMETFVSILLYGQDRNAQRDVIWWLALLSEDGDPPTWRVLGFVTAYLLGFVTAYLLHLLSYLELSQDQGKMQNVHLATRMVVIKYRDLFRHSQNILSF